MRIVAISDTHGRHRSLDLPEADMLIHAGDICARGNVEELQDFSDWLYTQNYKYKVVIAGNHDLCIENNELLVKKELSHCIYLQDNGVQIEGLNLWGSPMTPKFYNWAFMEERWSIDKYWRHIPKGLDILITHGPPFGILDTTSRGERVGCEALADRIRLVRPRLNIFGHIHESYGFVERDGLFYLNVASLDQKYKPVNPPVLFDFSKDITFL